MTMNTLTYPAVNVLRLPRDHERQQAPRAYLTGMTESGKSTLMEVLYNEYKRSVQRLRTLIVDTKPRFRAHYEMNGITTLASGRYRKWGKSGSGVIPGSYVLPNVENPKRFFDKIWRLGGDTVIAQADGKHEWGYPSNAARVFYEEYGTDEAPRLIIVDELADFFEQRTLSDIFQRIARNGRERDVALIAGSQRPRKIPVEIMTEMRSLYMFELQYWEDYKHIMMFGIPDGVERPEGHTFYFYDRKLKLNPPSNAYYELDLSSNYWTGGKYTRA